MVCDDIHPYKEYIKVTLNGLLAAAIIQSIFLFLTNVDTLMVIPKNGGIRCMAKETGDIDYCQDTVPDIMYTALILDLFDNSTNASIFQESSESIELFLDLMNTTTIEPMYEWQCGLYTDYANAPVFDGFLFTFSSATNYLIILVAFTITYVFFAIIHDWTLIYYKNDLKHVSFLPTSHEDFVLTSNLPRCIFTPIFWINQSSKNNCCYRILLTPLSVIWLILFRAWMLFDAVFTHTIMPIIWFVQSRFFGKKLHFNVWTISYISASYVGIARFWLTFSTIAMIYKSVLGFSFEIPAWDGDKCECECAYIFESVDWFRLLFTTSYFVFVNVQFLWEWALESAHGNHYLYLITHTLPVAHANIINPVECTGSMMKGVVNDKVKGQMTMEMVTRNQAQLQLLLAVSKDLNNLHRSERKYEEASIAGNAGDSRVSVELAPVSKSNKTNITTDRGNNEEKGGKENAVEETDGLVGFSWRADMVLIVIAYYAYYGWMTLWTAAATNYYGYPNWSVGIGYILGGCMLLGWGFVLTRGIYVLNIYEKERGDYDE